MSELSASAYDMEGQLGANTAHSLSAPRTRHIRSFAAVPNRPRYGRRARQAEIHQLGALGSLFSAESGTVAYLNSAPSRCSRTAAITVLAIS